MSDEPVKATDQDVERSIQGLQPHVASALCYLLGFVSAIVFLILEKRDREVRFHAYQSLATFGGLFVVSSVVTLIPLFGKLVALILTPISFILWIVLMVKALQGERLELPIVGDWAQERADDDLA